MREFIGINSNAKLNHAKYKKYVKDFRFINEHVVRRKFFLHFRKCQKNTCSHCSSQPIISKIIAETLKPLKGTIPYPVLLDNEEYYIKFPALIENLELKKKSMKLN